MLPSLFSIRRALAGLILLLATATACSQPAPDPGPGSSVVNNPAGLLGSWTVTPIGYYPDEAKVTFTDDGRLTISDWCHGAWTGNWTVSGRSAISFGLGQSGGESPCRVGKAPWMTDTQMYQIVDDSHVLFRAGDNRQTASLERTAYPRSANTPAAWSAQPELPHGYRPANEDALRSQEWLIDGVPVSFHPVSGSRSWISGNCVANTGSWSVSKYGYFAATPAQVIPAIACGDPWDLDAADMTIRNTVRIGMNDSVLAMVTADGTTTTIARVGRPGTPEAGPRGEVRGRG